MLLPIVPYPQEVSVEKGSFRVSGANFNCDNDINREALNQIEVFAEHLSLVCDKRSTVAKSIGLQSSAESGKIKGFVFLMDSSIPAEGYCIKVSGNSALVKASDSNGFLYAIQTIKQLLPVDIYGNTPNYKARWALPCCTIKDSPRFAYRGMHLDVSRHFRSVDEVKRYIDVMAAYKLNRLHWHLTDDQGWRIEIRKYPRLTEIGAFRKGTAVKKDFSTHDGIRYGGFYTQEQVREVIEYASQRGITIIPEIDLPGHMLAALASYPELGCSGGPYEVWTRWGVASQVLCPGKENTLKFLEDVLGEVADLFPSEYIHIGGDECPKDEWKNCPLCQAKIAKLGLKGDAAATAEQRLQNYVTYRMQKFLESKGKKIIGWDEILEGELSEGATVMSWRGTKGGIKAAKMGFDVIMTPTDYCYFDFYQLKDKEAQPFGIGGYLPISKVYSFDPYAGLNQEQQKHILGVQSNLWTEYISSDSHLEYMLLPRMLALCEVQWCSEVNRDYDRFLNVLKSHEFTVLDRMGYNYCKELE